jgi:hypothetical protein
MLVALCGPFWPVVCACMVSLGVAWTAGQACLLCCVALCRPLFVLKILRGHQPGKGVHAGWLAGWLCDVT